MTDKITCPNCGHAFDVEEALSGKLEARIRADYEKKMEKQAEVLHAEKKKLDADRLHLQEQQARQAEQVKAELARVLEVERKKIESAARESVDERMKALSEEVEKRKAENKQLREKEIALLQRENQLKDRESELQLQLQKELLERQQEIEEKAKAKERENFDLERRQLLKQIEDNKKLAEEMKRKAEQGSMQLQGEVQELALEELLRQVYPFDRIGEVPKGMRGADCIQVVVNGQQQECGRIVYESKRTKAFGGDWIEKLKQDQVACKADLAVIVTETMPSDMDRFGMKEGVWICGFHEVRSVSMALRQILLSTQAVRRAQENQGSKMEMLYAYLTSNEFVQQITRIVENYKAMRDQLNSEKTAMTRQWATREKQIELVQQNIAVLFGSIQGIAGNELGTPDILELPA